MMMDCPRCGFAQPKDRYCANCGLDVEHFLLKPKPLWIRILQNPNFHLSLIGLLIVFVAGYILYSRSELVSREVGHFLGTPISSREAAEPGDEAEAKPEAARVVAKSVANETAALTVPAAESVGQSGEEPPPKPAAAVDPTKLDLGFWEVPRDTLATLIPAAEKVGESNEGRVYLFKDASKLNDAMKSARRISLNRSAPLQVGNQILIVTPPQASEAFQFGFALSLAKWEDKTANVRWDSQLVLSQPETTQEMASPNPAVKAVTEVNLNGSVSLSGTGAVVIVFDPSNRRPREEYIAKVGDGPWSVFSSEDFRAGSSDWVAVFQLK